MKPTFQLAKDRPPYLRFNLAAYIESTLATEGGYDGSHWHHNIGRNEIPFMQMLYPGAYVGAPGVNEDNEAVIQQLLNQGVEMLGLYFPPGFTPGVTPDKIHFTKGYRLQETLTSNRKKIGDPLHPDTLRAIAAHWNREQ